jgi:hypothetical protein
MQEPIAKHPQSLRIPPDLATFANEIAEGLGETQLSKILNQALAIGLPALAASISPDENGKLAGKEPLALAKILRRKLAAAVDLMIEHGQLPGVALATLGVPAAAPDLPSSSHGTEEGADDVALDMLDSQMGDDLEQMGFVGMNLSATIGR